MTNPDSLRRQLISEFDAWLPDIISGKVTTVEILIRPYRKEGQEVASSGKRDHQHMREAKE